MPIKLIVKKNQSTAQTALSINQERIAEILDIKENTFNLKVYFGLNLNNSEKSPGLYEKVKITVLSENQRISSNSGKNYNSFSLNDFTAGANSNAFLVKKNPALSPNANLENYQTKLEVDSNFKTKYRSAQNIENFSREKYDASRETVVSLNKKEGDQNSVTSKTVFVNKKVKDAISTPVKFTDLELPDIVSIQQNSRFLSQNPFSFNLEAKKSQKSMQSILQKDYSELASATDYEKSLFDFIINDAGISVTDPRFNAVPFFLAKPNSKFLDVLQISTDIVLDNSLIDRSLAVKFELYLKNEVNANETITIPLRLANYTEAYYALTDKINFSHNRVFDNFTVKENFQASCSGPDDKKILSFNLYEKDLSLENSKFVFKTTIQKNEIYTINEGKFGYLKSYRIKPITSFGESNVFSDLIVSGINSQASDKSETINLNTRPVFLHARQTGNSSITVKIKPKISTDFSIKKIKIYRRDCTNSPFEEFKIHDEIYETLKTDEINFEDGRVLVGHTYEYFAELVDNRDIVIGSTNSHLLKFNLFNNNTHQVRVTNIVTSLDSIQFNIATISLKQDTKKIFEQSAASPLKLFDQQTGETVSTNLNDYQEIAYHKVTRINSITGEKQIFDLVRDGTFVDGPESRLKNNISAIDLNIPYIYQVDSYKRNPVSLTKDFFVVDKNAGSFYRPSKWFSPFVMETGILYSETDDGMSDLSETEQFMSDFIGTTLLDGIQLGTSFFDSIDSAATSIISKNVVKISWSETSTYDMFIVLKIVNGKKKILGTTSTNFIYHFVNEEEDLGTIFYEVMPVFNNTIYKSFISDILTFKQTLADIF